jgi:hypothetical protein
VENDRGLVDWGVARLYSRQEEEFLARVEAVLRNCAAGALVIEEYDGNHRAEVMKRRTEALSGFARVIRIRVLLVRRSVLYSSFNVTSSYHLMIKLATAFPELEQHVFRKRRPWDSQDERTYLFRAVGLAIGSQGEVAHTVLF